MVIDYFTLNYTQSGCPLILRIRKAENITGPIMDKTPTHALFYSTLY